MEKLKNELNRQLAAARIINKNEVSSLSNQSDHDEGDGEEEDFLSEEDFNLQHLFEDFRSNPDACAFPSSKQRKCLTNRQVFRLLNNRSDLLKTSRTIEQKLSKPNEHMCTSIDLSTSKTHRK